MNPRVEELRAKVGQPLASSDWVTVTQEMVNGFADATGDHQFIHVDPERAAQSPFGGPIAHGFLTLSLLAGSLKSGELENALDLQARMVVNYGLNKVRFVTPVPVGGRVRTNAKVLDVQQPESGEWVQVELEHTIELEGAPKPAVVAQTLSRIYL